MRRSVRRCSAVNLDQGISPRAVSRAADAPAADDETGRLLRMMAEVDGSSDVQTTLEHIIITARDNVEQATGASITVRHADGTLETVAATDDDVRALDALQYELGEGPCYEAVTDGHVSVSSQLGADPRWPRFGPQAVQRGFRSQMGVRMSHRRGAVTAMNLYAETAGAFTAGDEMLAIFAHHAGVVLDRADQLESMGRALDSREEIGRAVGVVMERYQLSEGRAFEYLVRVSNHSNTKVRAVAAQLLAEIERAT